MKETNVIIVRYGEIAVKGVKTRRRMQSILINNIKESLQRNRVEKMAVKAIPGRILVYPENGTEKAIRALTHVFGITSVSPAYHSKFDKMETILEKALELVEDEVRNKIFMVRARRVGKHDFTSKDVERQLGSLILSAGGKKVDLKNPEIIVNVEIRDNLFFVYTKEYEGPGGLPLGSEGKILALVSGGFDSTVASWTLMKRGAKVDMVFFNIGGEDQKTQVLEVLKKFTCDWCYGYHPILYIVELRWVFPILQLFFPQGFWPVALKKTMYLAAQIIAKQINAKAIATGESLAQVASQTLHNLYVTEKGIELPVLRPLIGMDKEDIIKISRRIGTYELSSKIKEFCAIASPKPSTAVNVKKFEELFWKHLNKDVISENISNSIEKIELIEKCE